MEFSSGFHVITGETGAGKSILRTALEVLLGGRVDKNMNQQLRDKCIIEAAFKLEKDNLKAWFQKRDLDYDTTTLLRRELLPDRRSRAFINDTPVSLEVLRSLSHHLVDIHSQYDNLLLKNQQFQLSVLDKIANNYALQESYQTLYNKYACLNKKFANTQAQKEHNQKELDYARFLLQELKQANLENLNQEAIETELKKLIHAEEIQSQVQNTLAYLANSDNNAQEKLTQANHTLEQTATLSPDYSDFSKRLNSCLIELRDIAAELESTHSQIQYDPEKIKELTETLDNLYTLQKKHKAHSVAALSEIQKTLEAKIESLENRDEATENLIQEINRVKVQLTAWAEELSNKRQAATSNIKKHLENILVELGIKHAQVHFELSTKATLCENGYDALCIKFSANKGVPPLPLEKIASGGELSRFMLALKSLLMEQVPISMILFDEIDVGVSGEVAQKVGRIMCEMAQHQQVLAITHLPQIASQSDRHFLVYKEESQAQTTTKIKSLQPDERVFEIAKMISGDPPTFTAIKHAKELISPFR